MGMVPTLEAVKSFVVMQADSNASIVALSNEQLTKISKSRINFIVQVLNSGNIFDQLYQYQKSIKHPAPSGFVIIVSNSKEELETDIGVLDFTVNLLKSEDEKLCASVLSNFIRFGTDFQLLEHDRDISLMKFYGEVLFSLCKFHTLTKPINNFCSINEQNVY